MSPQLVPRRALGRTGLKVSVVGLGGGPLGDPTLDERTAAVLVDRALERGVDLFDTARSYGCSEERLGRLLQGRRDRVTLSTKVGYGVPGHDDWTGGCVAAGVDRALRVLRTDRVDLVHLHSCDRHVLARGDVVRALEDAVRAGKVRVAAYSGEESDLDAAIACGVFGAVQISVSPWDQRSLWTRVPALAARGVGVLAKRALANAPWRFEARPEAPDMAAYWDRFRALAIDPHGLSWSELALRFGAFAPGVSSALIGTRSIAHLDAAADAIGRGPLDPALLGHLSARFDAVGADLHGIV